MPWHYDPCRFVTRSIGVLKACPHPTPDTRRPTPDARPHDTRARPLPPYTVQLDAYHGPLDLLLYLVRKEELPIADLPLAEVAEQYLEHITVLERIDPNAAGEFLDVASRLVELKSLSVLPAAEEAVDDGARTHADEIESPSDLVERLLEYKRYRDAADKLETLRLDWSRRRTRPAAPPRRAARSARPIEHVEVWDLVAAFAAVMRRHEQRAAQTVHTLRNDETPLHVHLERIDRRLRASQEPTSFEDLFPDATAPKATLIALFVAVLELLRYRHAVARQDVRFGPIHLAAGPVPYKPAQRVQPAA